MVFFDYSLFLFNTVFTAIVMPLSLFIAVVTDLSIIFK